MPQQSNDHATAYVITFPPIIKSDIQHTSLYVVGPNNEVITRSIQPSSKGFQNIWHLSTKAIIPVQAFNTKGPSSDVKIQYGPPSSILKIKSLQFAPMQKENKKFLRDINASTHLFSMYGRSFKNPLHYLLSVLNAHRYPNELKVGGFDPIITQYPTSDDLIFFKYKHKLTHFSNCTMAVDRLLKAGGLQVEQDKTRSRLSYFFPSFFSVRPSTYQRALESVGEEMIHKQDQLPEALQKAIVEGQEESKKNSYAPGIMKGDLESLNRILTQ